MIMTRRADIVKSLQGLGTQEGELYTNQEIVDCLRELQGAMAKGVFEKEHAENLSEKDLMIHFSALAQEYGLDSTEVYLRFERNMNELCYTIGSLVKGMQGERNARKSLRLLACDKNVEIIFNLQLGDEELRAEYDAVAITPYGMFILEVKNWDCDLILSSDGVLLRNDNRRLVCDLAGKMSNKEALLRGILGEDFPAVYQAFLLFSTVGNIKDYWKQFPICRGGGITYKIRDYDYGEEVLSPDQIADVANKLRANHKVQKGACYVRCQELIDDYAILMSQIEEAARIDCEEDGIALEKVPVEVEKASGVDEDMSSQNSNSANWLGIAAGLAAGTIGLATATALVKFVLERKAA